jgi:autotransporter-associated beta strand protein
MNLGADNISVTSEAIQAVAQGNGTISIDTAGTTISSSGLYAVVALGGAGETSIGSHNGGISGTITAPSGSGILLITTGGADVTLSSDELISAQIGIEDDFGTSTGIDNYGTIVGSIAIKLGSVDASVILEAGSRTVAAVKDDTTSFFSQVTFTIFTGADVSQATFVGASSGNHTIDLNGTGSQLFDLSTASGIQTVQKDGTGIWQLANLGNFDAITYRINGGKLQATAQNVIKANSDVFVAAAGTFDLAGFSQKIGSLAGSGIVTLGSAILDTGSDNASTVFSGSISGAGGLNKSGTGTFTLSGVNSYTGHTVINTGTLKMGIVGALSPMTDVSIANGAVFDLSGFNQTIGSLAGQGNVELGSAVLDTNGDNTSSTFEGQVSGAGGLTKSGAGILTLASVSDYTGLTQINAGTLSFGTTNAISVQSDVTVAGGAVLDLGGFVQTIGSLAGSGNVVNDNAGLFVNGNNASTLYSGGIAGSSFFAKDGTGTLTLLGGNTYEGDTFVDSGTLAAGAQHVLA